MSLKDYKPIDYFEWDSSGKGRNIFGLTKDREAKLWSSALIRQDKRQDKGHAENATYFAFQLLKYHWDIAKRNIVIPSVILHDTGYSFMFPEELALFRTSIGVRYDAILRQRHQEEGVKFAKKILGWQNYSKQEINHITEIISQHDTRQGFFSLEDKIVRDADKLARFTPLDFEISKKYHADTDETWEKRMKENLNKESFFFTTTARAIAKSELVNTLKYSKNIGQKH